MQMAHDGGSRSSSGVMAAAPAPTVAPVELPLGGPSTDMEPEQQEQQGGSGLFGWLGGGIMDTVKVSQGLKKSCLFPVTLP